MARPSASLLRAFNLMRTEVIHPCHAAGAQPRAQDLVQTGEEDFPVGGGLDGDGGDQAAGADGKCILC